MILQIKIISRDPVDPRKFIGDFLKINLKNFLNLKHKKMTHRGRTRKRFTTLKSPHVHKDAQTSFELVSYYYTLKIRSDQVSKFLSFYKKFLCQLTPDIKVRITLKVPKHKTLLEKKHLLRNIRSWTTKDSLPNYLTQLGFLGKVSFSM
jgi:Ribosomal protein S10p/S20e